MTEKIIIFGVSTFLEPDATLIFANSEIFIFGVVNIVPSWVLKDVETKSGELLIFVIRCYHSFIKKESSF